MKSDLEKDENPEKMSKFEKLSQIQTGMLLEFSVTNYLSIKERITLDLRGTGISEYAENVISSGKIKVLRSAVLYGANSSGKSNVLKAIRTMRKMVLESARASSTDTLDITPFLLNDESEQQPSAFEILIVLGDIRYRYGFEIDQQKVHTEWLFSSKRQAEKQLFVRDHDIIELGPGFKEGKDLERKTRQNALFLSVVDQFNGPISQKILAWFKQLNAISGIEHELDRAVTFLMLEKANTAGKMKNFIKQLDLGFNEVQIQRQTFNDSHLPDGLSPEMVRELKTELTGQTLLKFLVLHDVIDDQGIKVGTKTFDLDRHESSGTNKLFDIIGPVFQSLIEGGVLVVDELDAKLHPLITKSIVNLFNSEETNPQNAQLIFATHDTNLLNYGMLRRDQIYFTEKRRDGSTDLYSLIEYKENGQTVRKDRSFEKDYIEGKYGAIPYIGNFQGLITQWQNQEKLTTPSSND